MGQSRAEENQKRGRLKPKAVSSMAQVPGGVASPMDSIARRKRSEKSVAVVVARKPRRDSSSNPVRDARDLDSSWAIQLRIMS